MERLFQALGADPDFTEDIFGDLAEEYALREIRDGAGGARWWYACETLRSAPYLVRSAAQHSAGRTRLALLVTGISVGSLCVILAIRSADGPAARLVFGTADAFSGIIVNNVRPVQIPLRVLDAAGHELKSAGVQYRWESGAPVSVAASGTITCTHDGDTRVRATLGALEATALVHCRPVHNVRSL